jgi:hypothetical protein
MNLHLLNVATVRLQQQTGVTDDSPDSIGQLATRDPKSSVHAKHERSGGD